MGRRAHGASLPAWSSECLHAFTRSHLLMEAADTLTLLAKAPGAVGGGGSVLRKDTSTWALEEPSALPPEPQLPRGTFFV